MQEKIKNSKGEIVSFITQITLENGKVYMLYTDGKLYEDVNGSNFVEVNNLSEQNRQIIAKIMKKLEPEKTDVIDTKKVSENKVIVEAKEPEL